MSFDENPADNDSHWDCRRKIAALEAERDALRKQVKHWTDPARVAGCNFCKGSIYEKQERFEESDRWYHAQCKITQRAEFAEAERDRMRAGLEETIASCTAEIEYQGPLRPEGFAGILVRTLCTGIRASASATLIELNRTGT